jgi:hypothetical protein
MMSDVARSLGSGTIEPVKMLSRWVYEVLDSTNLLTLPFFLGFAAQGRRRGLRNYVHIGSDLFSELLHLISFPWFGECF